MIPIKDTIRSRSFPFVNLGLIALNVVIFLYELSLPSPALDRLVGVYGLVPAYVHLQNPISLGPIFTSMFLHGGWLHIISNMWVLFIFGDNVEDRLGHGRYFIFYLLSGLAAGLMQIFVSTGSLVPTIGASGAIAGVLGAYFSFFPAARVLALIPVFIIPWFIQVPAILFLGFWFISQLFSGVLSLGASDAGGIAWWAHVGGFIFGLIAARIFFSSKRTATWATDRYWPR
ncbi:MAG: rhomboid family intramembrane serine protease [Chloroflexi bacterium]|nr:rhomboid family intramembrane serine protease [Chloroflexota bacterium]